MDSVKDAGDPLPVRVQLDRYLSHSLVWVRDGLVHSFYRQPHLYKPAYLSLIVPSSLWVPVRGYSFLVLLELLHFDSFPACMITGIEPTWLA